MILNSDIVFAEKAGLIGNQRHIWSFPDFAEAGFIIGELLKRKFLTRYSARQ
jgi:hypothetical protein